MLWIGEGKGCGITESLRFTNPWILGLKRQMRAWETTTAARQPHRADTGHRHQAGSGHVNLEMGAQGEEWKRGVGKQISMGLSLSECLASSTNCFRDYLFQKVFTVKSLRGYTVSLEQTTNLFIAQDNKDASLYARVRQGKVRQGYRQL